jgi:hypothetical protein
MEKNKTIRWLLGSTLAVLLGILTFDIVAQDVQQNQSAVQQFSQEQLNQMLAPIALYPDKLLAQVLTASTYPLDVTSADKFAKANSSLKGDDLLNAAKGETWDPSVKSMLGFPDVLDMMNKHIDWTSNLGTAFLQQQDDVMNTIQSLRDKAFTAGNLKTTKQQVVKKVEKVIYIEPASSNVVYVPAYDPGYVYGNWQYPSYPPYNYYPSNYYSGADIAGTALVSFLAGAVIGSSWGWGSWNYDWHQHHMYYNTYQYNQFANHYYSQPMYQLSGTAAKQKWQYNPLNRQGVGPHGMTKFQGVSGVKGGQLQGISGLKGAGQLHGVSGISGANKLQGVSGMKGVSSAGQFARPSISTTEQRLHAGSKGLQGNKGFTGVTTTKGAATTFKGGKYQGKSFTGVTTTKGAKFQGSKGNKGFTGVTTTKGAYKGVQVNKGFQGVTTTKGTYKRAQGKSFQGVTTTKSVKFQGNKNFVGGNQGAASFKGGQGLQGGGKGFGGGGRDGGGRGRGR